MTTRGRSKRMPEMDLFGSTPKHPAYALEPCAESPTGNHHFLLPQPAKRGNDRTVGVCRYCGASREHSNAPDYD